MKEHERDEESVWVEPNEDWCELLVTKGSINGSFVGDAKVELDRTFMLDDGGDKDDVMEREVEMGGGDGKKRDGCGGRWSWQIGFRRE